MNLQDAYSDFILSREAMNVTERMMVFYKFTLYRILDSLRNQGVQGVSSLRASHIRVILKQLRDSGLSDSYIHQHARVSKTFFRFCKKEGYIDKEISFEMPKIASKHLRVLDINEMR
jgi:site-specific recombinase XerD